MRAVTVHHRVDAGSADRALDGFEAIDAAVAGTEVAIGQVPIRALGPCVQAAIVEQRQVGGFECLRRVRPVHAIGLIARCLATRLTQSRSPGTEHRLVFKRFPALFCPNAGTIYETGVLSPEFRVKECAASPGNLSEWRDSPASFGRVIDDGWKRKGKISRKEMLTFTTPAERCRSGRTGQTRNLLYALAYRGFESHPLRQI